MERPLASTAALILAATSLLLAGCGKPRPGEATPPRERLASTVASCVPTDGIDRVIRDLPHDAAPLRVLCLASEDLRVQGLDGIEPKALEAYRKAGFELHFDTYQHADEAELRSYPVVVGMMPMLHAGTRAIDARLGLALERYVRDGGGFLLIPAPSYYGGEDFIRQLNPWLMPFGAELLNEMPRDPANQKTVSRVLPYRYLQTANIPRSALTEGVKSLWLPLDFTDAYVATHSLRVSSEWEVLVKGERSCSTHPYMSLRGGQTEAGAWASEPPLLATRPLGKGRMAIFATSSQYFIFDAFHWAYGGGFVLREGDGFRLMANLLRGLASGRPDLAGVAAVKAPSTQPGDGKEVPGGVGIFPDKEAWMRHVLGLIGDLAPRDLHVRAYVDCGGLSDLPWTPERGMGWTDTGSWLIRWSWSEPFHATAANARGFDVKPLAYRFDGLDPARRYKLGCLVWARQTEGARGFAVDAGGAPFLVNSGLPRFADRKGPAFLVVDVPPEAIEAGSLKLNFKRAEGGTGTFSSVCELWLLESGGAEARPVSEIREAYESPSEDRKEVPFDRKLFRGVIGEARAPVAELAGAAREAGLDFVVLNRDAAKLDADGLERFKEECRASSSGAFLAVPGITFEGVYASEKPNRPDRPHGWGKVNGYVFQNLVRLPPPADCRSGYELFWKFLGGEYGGGKASPPTLRAPLANGIPAWFQRFWRGFDVITMGRDGAIVEDARVLYAELLAAGYGPFPRASGVFASGAEVRAAAQKGWVTTVYSENLGMAVANQHTTCVGNGPVFRSYWWSFDHARDCTSGDGILFRESEWLVLHAEVESPAELESVTLFSGQVPLRTWRPAAKRFTIEEPILVGRNHELWLRAEAKGGLDAFTGRFLVQDRRFLIGMCADNQNTICSLTVSPTRYENDEREMYLQHSYWHTGEAAGQLGTMRRARDLVPRVIETGIIQPLKSFVPMPCLRFADGTEEDHGSARMRIAEASGCYNVVEYVFDSPGAKARSNARLTSYRPAEGGDTSVFVEVELEALRDLELAVPGGIQLLRLGLMPTMAPEWKYTVMGERGHLSTGKFPAASPDWSDDRRLTGDGGLLIWPCEVGSLLVLPLDGEERQARFFFRKSWNARECVTILDRRTRLRAGEKLSARFLVALHPGEVRTGDEVSALRRRYTSEIVAAFHPRRGKVRDSGGIAHMDAVDGAVTGVADSSRFHAPLPAEVHMVNPAWSCALQFGGRLEVSEAADATLKAVFLPGVPRSPFVLGNLLQSDAAELRLEWGGAHAGGARIHAHWPGSTARTCRLGVNRAFMDLPAAEGKWGFASGQSAWLWGRGSLLVRESGGLQVVDATAGEGGVLTLEVRGSGGLEFAGASPDVRVNGAARRAEGGATMVVPLTPGRHRVEFRPDKGR